MFKIPFLQPKGKSDGFVLLVFFSGEKIYGYAFEEANLDNRTALYSEHADPFLKDATDKIEKIILDCEKDLKGGAYLKKTVLFLNSLYATESGALREDFLKQIKKNLKNLDLENLGYVHLYEAVTHTYAESRKHFYIIEESVYDFTVYEVKQGETVKTAKVAKTQSEAENWKELEKILEGKTERIGFFYRPPQKKTFHIDILIQEPELIDIFTKIYFKNGEPPKNVPAQGEAEERKEPDRLPHSSLSGLPSAPGFTDGTEKTWAVPAEEDEKPPLKAEVVNKLSSFKMPKLNLAFQKKWLLFLAVFLIPGYLFFLHQADVQLTTKKENFSTEIDFVIVERKFGEVLSEDVAIKVSKQTSGEKEVGEKASGEVSIYNGSFEKKDIAEGTEIKTQKGGVAFVTLSSVTVPAATITANLDEGVVTRSFGKKSVGLKAVKIGADANINEGTKLVFADLPEDDFYAVATQDFSGGFKKTVRVFSAEDKEELSEKAMSSVKRELQVKFNGKKGVDNVLFIDTARIANPKEKLSAKMEDEVDNVTLELSGRASALYVPQSSLVKKVQTERLRDKEFIADTFEIGKLSLQEAEGGEYTYTAIVKGQVQNFIDRDRLLSGVTGKLVNRARNILDEERNITEFVIKTKPIPLPIMPLRKAGISFSFVD